MYRRKTLDVSEGLDRDEDYRSGSDSLDESGALAELEIGLKYLDLLSNDTYEGVDMRTNNPIVISCQFQQSIDELRRRRRSRRRSEKSAIPHEETVTFSSQDQQCLSILIPKEIKDLTYADCLVMQSKMLPPIHHNNRTNVMWRPRRSMPMQKLTSRSAPSTPEVESKMKHKLRTPSPVSHSTTEVAFKTPQGSFVDSAIETSSEISSGALTNSSAQADLQKYRSANGQRAVGTPAITNWKTVKKKRDASMNAATHCKAQQLTTNARIYNWPHGPVQRSHSTRFNRTNRPILPTPVSVVNFKELRDTKIIYANPATISAFGDRFDDEIDDNDDHFEIPTPDLSEDETRDMRNKPKQKPLPKPHSSYHVDRVAYL